VRATYFGRYQHEALLFVDAEDPWIEHHLRPLQGRVVGYAPELERYGGAEGLRLTEQVFQADSLPCLDLLAAESRGALASSRREVSLLLTERLLDLFGFDRAQRIDFHRSAYAWALEQGRWNGDDLHLLESRYASLRDGLAALLHAPPQESIVERWSAATRPCVEALCRAHAEGRIQQVLPALAWSCAHLQCNRLGIDGDAEAILRFFMQRLHEDGLGKVA
jgi:thiopeptide-type bacteriocin biosynthesis protein